MALLQSNPTLFCVRFSSAEINSHQTQISRDKLLSNKLNIQIAAQMLAFSRGSDIKQSLTSSQFQLQYDFQPLTFPRKAATTCEKDGVLEVASLAKTRQRKQPRHQNRRLKLSRPISVLDSAKLSST